MIHKVKLKDSHESDFFENRVIYTIRHDIGCYYEIFNPRGMLLGTIMLGKEWEILND